MDSLGVVSMMVVGVGHHWSRGANLSWNLPGHGVALCHWLWLTHLLRNWPGNSVTSCARNRHTNRNSHTVRSHHLSWGAHWHLAAFPLRHLVAERLSMSDSNRASSHQVAIGWTNQLGVSISISVSLPLAKGMTSMVASMSMGSNSRNSNSRGSMRNGDRSNVSSMCMPMGNANCLTNH